MLRIFDPRGQRQFPGAGFDGLRGVVDEVEEHLVQLRRRAGDGGDFAEIFLDRQMFQFMLGQQQRAVQPLVEVET